MHVVISGYYGFDNVGDEAILFSIIQALRHVQSNIDVTVLSNNPEKTAKTYDVNAVNRWRLSEIREALRQADGLISGGGSLLQDQTGMRSIPYYAGIMKMAQWMNKPTFVYAQGMGPFNRSISRWIVKHVLSRVDQITVRDEGSKDLLQEVGIERDIKIVPDPVLGLNVSGFQNDWVSAQAFAGVSEGSGSDMGGSDAGAGGSDAGAGDPDAGSVGGPEAGMADGSGSGDPDVSAADGSKAGVAESGAESSDEANAFSEAADFSHYPTRQNEFISVSVRDWPSDAAYLKKIAGGLDQLAQLGYAIAFVPMHGAFDESTSNKTAALMEEKSYVAPGDLSIEEKVSIIGQSELLIGMRLHSLVFAAANHVPFIALSYDPKIDAFASICVQPVVGHVSQDNWNANDLFAQASRALKYRTIQQDTLKHKADQLKEQARQTAQLAIKTFE